MYIQPLCNSVLHNTAYAESQSVFAVTPLHTCSFAGMGGRLHYSRSCWTDLRKGHLQDIKEFIADISRAMCDQLAALLEAVTKTQACAYARMRQLKRSAVAMLGSPLSDPNSLPSLQAMLARRLLAIEVGRSG